MSIRVSLSEALRQAKEEKGYVYEDLIRGTGCSKSSIRYALNRGDNVSLEAFQKLLDYMEVYVKIETESPEGGYE